MAIIIINEIDQDGIIVDSLRLFFIYFFRFVEIGTIFHTFQWQRHNWWWYWNDKFTVCGVFRCNWFLLYSSYRLLPDSILPMASMDRYVNVSWPYGRRVIYHIHGMRHKISKSFFGSFAITVSDDVDRLFFLSNDLTISFSLFPLLLFPTVCMPVVDTYRRCFLPNMARAGNVWPGGVQCSCLQMERETKWTKERKANESIHVSPLSLSPLFL